MNALEGKDTRGRTIANGKLTPPTIAALRPLIVEVGAGAPAWQTYAAKLWRYFLGVDALPPVAPNLRLGEKAPDGRGLAEWIKDRAWQALEAHEHELPPLDYSRKPKGLE